MTIITEAEYKDSLLARAILLGLQLRSREPLSDTDTKILAVLKEQIPEFVVLEELVLFRLRVLEETSVMLEAQEERHRRLVDGIQTLHRQAGMSCTPEDILAFRESSAATLVALVSQVEDLSHDLLEGLEDLKFDATSGPRLEPERYGGNEVCGIYQEYCPWCLIAVDLEDAATERVCSNCEHPYKVEDGRGATSTRKVVSPTLVP